MVWSALVRLLGLWLVLMGAPSLASASMLRWDVPRVCPDERHAAALMLRLGVPMEVGDSDDFSVTITLHASHSYRAEIRVRDAGTRLLEGDDCLRLAEAAVLVVAIAHDPMAVASSLSASEAPAQPVASAAMVGPQLGSVGGYVGLELGADLGSLPQASAGGGLKIGLALPHAVRVEMAALAFLPRATTRGPAAGASGEVGLFAGVARGCFEFALGVLRTGPCLAAELGVMRGRGRELDQPRKVSGIWSAGWLGLSLRARDPGRFVPVLLVEFGTPFERPSFEVNGFGQVFRSNDILVRALASLQVLLF